MGVLSLSCGAILVAVVVVDLAWTILGSGGGGGPITSRVGTLAWRAGLRLHRSWPSHRRLAVIGVCLLLLTPLVWMLLLWTGFSLVYLSADRSVLDGQTGLPVDGWSKVYFAGYALFTLGNGDLQPGSTAWQLTTVLTVAAGLALVTLGVSYLVPVVQAATQRRQLARSLRRLGGTPREVLERSWNGDAYELPTTVVSSLLPVLESSAEQHVTYPVLHVAHPTDPDVALAPSAAVVLEALVVMAAVPPPSRPPDRELVPVIEALGGMAETLATFPSERSSSPELMDLTTLQDEGLSVPERSALDACLDRWGEWRVALASLVAHEGWEWRHAVLRDEPTPAVGHSGVGEDEDEGEGRAPRADDRASGN